ncbi:hypothetical protein NQ317_008001 [Molorchus minor]|uniref:Uncharacterized protein n=1 Tax=Molorchus minor TaxID=1323400 RepID=A0ABQ9IUA3_9CUCU|nr:hypothetical protein NQ317_008001 [Molorchus minor]
MKKKKEIGYTTTKNHVEHECILPSIRISLGFAGRTVKVTRLFSSPWGRWVEDAIRIRSIRGTIMDDI